MVASLKSRANLSLDQARELVALLEAEELATRYLSPIIEDREDTTVFMTVDAVRFTWQAIVNIELSKGIQNTSGPCVVQLAPWRRDQPPTQYSIAPSTVNKLFKELLNLPLSNGPDQYIEE
jgi:hypothetical protein